MDLLHIALQDFLLLQATWNGDMCLQLLKNLKPSHAIIHKAGLADHYYLFERSELEYMIMATSRLALLPEIINTYSCSPTLLLAGEANAEEAPELCIVLEEGHPVGFIDDRFPTNLGGVRGSKSADSREREDDLQLRSFITRYPDQVLQYEVFSVLVSLSSRGDVGNLASLPLALPAGTKVDIVILPDANLILEDGNTGSLIVSDELETLPFQFALQGKTPGPAQFKIFAFHRGQSLGSLTLHILILHPMEDSEIEQSSKKAPLLPIIIRPPDLSLLIFEQEQGENTLLTFRLSAQDPTLELNFKPYGPVELKRSALSYFQDFFRDVEMIHRSSTQQREITLRLVSKGVSLFERLFPVDLQVMLWSLQDRIHSVQIQSTEQWIPWELCTLCGKIADQVVEGPFLCEAFAVTRWTPGIALKPRLNLQHMAIVVPSQSSLPFAFKERDYLLSLTDEKLSRTVHSIPATFLDLRAAFSAGVYDSWHFVGHGSSFQKNAVLHLENQSEFSDEELCGIVKNLGKTHPLVFLNACYANQPEMALTGVNTWASQFLRCGVSAFIGSYWTIYDESAHRFAQALYTHLFSGMPIGKATQEARLAIKSPVDPTWLAYTVFADPLARVQTKAEPD